MANSKLKIGFIGQGWIGKNYADDFENRGFDVTRYSLEEPYVRNKEKIKDCDIVFIAVPTPTIKNVFNDSYVKDALKNIGKGKTAVIKSTILPGTTEKFQKENPEIFVMHSPEFLVEATAAYDAAHPSRNIIGIPVDNEEYRKKAEEVMDVLPESPFKLICPAKEAELIKYGSNVFLYTKVVYANLLHDLAEELGCDWKNIRDMIAADARIGKSHMEPIHQSGRGAGGHCFIKDYEAFFNLYKEIVGDELGEKFFESLRNKNLDLLKKSNKDLELLEEVYGEITNNQHANNQFSITDGF